jgi:hypothetical protein
LLLCHPCIWREPGDFGFSCQKAGKVHEFKVEDGCSLFVKYAHFPTNSWLFRLDSSRPERSCWWSVVFSYFLTDIKTLEETERYLGQWEKQVSPKTCVTWVQSPKCVFEHHPPTPSQGGLLLQRKVLLSLELYWVYLPFL